MRRHLCSHYLLLLPLLLLCIIIIVIIWVRAARAATVFFAVPLRAAPRQRPRGTYTHRQSYRGTGQRYTRFYLCRCLLHVCSHSPCSVSLVSCVFFSRPFGRTIRLFSFFFAKGRFLIDPNCLRLYDIIVRFKRAAAAVATDSKGFIGENVSKRFIVPRSKLSMTIKYR